MNKYTGIRIKNPEDIYNITKNYANKKQEHFILITLNGASEVIKIHNVTKGLVNMVLVHPREVFSRALKDLSVSIAFVHNHPSGNIDETSEKDKEITERLCSVAKIMGICVIDHVIISKNGWRSMAKHGELLVDWRNSKTSDYEYVAEILKEYKIERIQIGGKYGYKRNLGI